MITNNIGVIGTALFLGQTLSPREYIGCAVVLLAVVLSQLPERKGERSDGAAAAEGKE